MARVRKPLTMRLEGALYVTRFEHPRRLKTVRVKLGRTAQEAGAALDWLNKVFLHPEFWDVPPVGMPGHLRDEWLGPAAGTSTTGSTARDGEGRALPSSADAVAVLKLMLEDEQRETRRLNEVIRRMAKEIEHWKGSRIRTGPCPTLQDAFDAWKKTALLDTGERHRKNVFGDLQRFVHRFGASTEVDDMAGRETEINAWLHGLPGRTGDGLAPSRRQQMRIAILRFLDDVGVKLERKKGLPSATADDIRKARGPIRWLEKADAQRLTDELEQPYADAFRIQCGLGLRCEELLTLHRNNFSVNPKGEHVLTLAPLGKVGLKNGPRTIQPIPASVWSAIERRLKGGDVLFPNPKTNKAEANPPSWDRRYARALAKAASKAKIETKVDARTGRRTCASLLLRAKVPIEHVAALLGDRVDMIREHYARILPSEANPKAAALK
ncbi:MAG: tyrosine-type recombinase/integrase [Planctomycetes bacterium]|nr:tyrosine-type recombinase/integrase [Planctomycetota bacterium]